MALADDDEPIGPIGPVWEPGEWKALPAVAAAVVAVVALILAVPVSSEPDGTAAGAHEPGSAAVMIHVSDDGVFPTVVSLPVGSVTEVMNVGSRARTVTVGTSQQSLQVAVDPGGSALLDLGDLPPGSYVFTDGVSAGTLTISS